MEQLRKSLAASTRSDKKSNAAAPLLHFGLISVTGKRWVTEDAQKANDAFGHTGSRIQGVFHTRKEAKQWEAAGASGPDSGPSSSDDGSSDNDSTDGHPSHPHRKSRSNLKQHPIGGRKVRGARHRPSRRTQQNEKTCPEIKRELKDTKQQLADCRKKLKERSSGRRSSHRHDSSDSPDDDSSDPSTSSSLDVSDSSSSDSSRSSHGSHCRCRKCRKTREYRKERARTRKHKHHQKRCCDVEDTAKYRLEDPSKGTKDKVFGMSINGTKLDKAIAPADLRTKEQSEFYNAAVDVTSLPGGWNPQKGRGLQDELLFNESQKVASLAATILAASTRVRSNMEIRDTSYNSLTRHSMGRIRDRESLFEFVGKLSRSREPAFQQQANLIQQFMYARHYSEAYATEYLQNGLLPRLVRLTFENFYELANAIRQLAFDHPNWETGPSKAMLEHHADKLWSIREMAITRKQLILQMYVYLQDSQAKGFYHESMSEALWKRLEDTSKSGPKNGVGGATPSDTKCGHCGTKELHRLVGKPGQKRYCPVKHVVEPSKAKEAAKWVVEQHHADPDKDVHELIATAVEQFK